MGAIGRTAETRPSWRRWSGKGCDPIERASDLNRALKNGDAAGAAAADDDTPVRWRRLSTVAPRAVPWIWPKRIAAGEITLVNGDPGSGKSLFAATVAVRRDARAILSGQDRIRSNGRR